MYFQRQEVIGSPPILASLGSIFSTDSKKDKLSPTYQLFVGIGYIFYLIIFMIVITKVIQPNEEYSSIYSIQNILKSANWDPDLSTPKNSMLYNIQTNSDIQNWVYYVLGPPLLNGHVADQNQIIGASLTKCVGEYIENMAENHYIPSDYGVVKVLNLSNCKKTRLNLVSRIASPYKYMEAFFDSSKDYVIQEIESNPELPVIPKLSNKTDVISYKAELLFYNGNIDTYSVVSFSFNLSIFGTFTVDVLSQSASPLKKYIGFPCNGSCNLNITQIAKSAFFLAYGVIFFLQLISGILLLISSASGSPSNSFKDSEKNGTGIESWSNYFKERSLSIAIRISHFSVILLWVSSAVLVQLLPQQSLKSILEQSNKTAENINFTQSSEVPLLNSIISTIQIASIVKFTGTVIACIASFLMLFRIFQIFSSLFSQVNVPLKTIILYFKKIVGLFFLINLIILTFALGIIIYLHIDKFSANIKGIQTSISTSVFSLMLAPFSSSKLEGTTEEVFNKIPTVIFFSILLGIITLYLLLIPLSTATIMFIYNEVEILQSLKQNTDNIYTIKTTLSSWIQQLFFLSTFWQSKKLWSFSSQSHDSTIKVTNDTQNEIEAQSNQKINANTKDIVLSEERGQIDKLNEKCLNQMLQQKKKQFKKFFEVPPKLEYIPYHLFFLIVLFSIVSIFWIINVINNQLHTETGDVIWKILDSPFRARSFYTFDPTLDFFPYMFKDCSKKNENPNFLYNKNQLSNIPQELLFGLYQSYRLTNVTSLSHLKSWIQKIFIPLIKAKNSQNSAKSDFLIDLGHPTLYSVINPMLLFKQHFSPVKCNSNPISSGLYQSTISRSKSSLSIKDISNFNALSLSKAPGSTFNGGQGGGLAKIRNIFSRILRLMSFERGIFSRKLAISQEKNSHLESSLSSSGVDRIFFLYAGQESEISDQFNKSLYGTDEGNLFWAIRSYSLSTGSEVSVDLLPSLDSFASNENFNIPFSGLFDFSMDTLEIYFPIMIPNQSSVSLLKLKFEIFRTGKIEIEYGFDFVKREWISQAHNENGVYIDSKKKDNSDSELSENQIESQINDSDLNSNTWLFSFILIGIQCFIFLIFFILVIFNFYRKRLLSKRLMHQINYKMDVSESESEAEMQKKKKIRKFGIRKIAKKIKRKEIDSEALMKKQKLESFENIHFNEKKNVLEFRKKKVLHKKQNKEAKEEIAESKFIVEEELNDEDILSVYKLSNLNILIIAIMLIAFFILFFSSIAYYILIISTKISINTNTIDIEGGFNSIASSHGNTLPWEIDKSNLNDFNSKLNMIGSSSGFYNDNVFSFGSLFKTINSIQEISGYFEMFEIIGVLLIITYLSIIFIYSSLLVDRHRRTKILKMKRYMEKTGKKITGSSFESLSVFTFMDTTSQRGFSWNDANYALIPIFCIVASFILIFSLIGYSILGYQETSYFSYYYSVLSSLLIIFNYNSVKQVITISITPDMSIRFKSNIITFIWRPIYYLLTFFTFNFILKALIPASIIFYMRSVASKNLQISQDTLLSKLNNVAVTRPSIPIFMNDCISLRMKFFIKALYKKLGKFKNFDMYLMKANTIEGEQSEGDINLKGENPDWIFAKLIPEFFNEIVHYKLNIAELVNKDQQGIQEVRDYLGSISLQLLLIQEHLVKIEFLRCKLSMIRQELMKIEDVKKDISRGNRESQHYIDRLLQRLMSINDEIEHLDESNKVLGQEKESIKQKTTNVTANYSLQKEKERFSTDFLFEYGNSYAKVLFENSRINDISSSDQYSDGGSEEHKYPDETNRYNASANYNTKKKYN